MAVAQGVWAYKLESLVGIRIKWLSDARYFEDIRTLVFKDKAVFWCNKSKFELRPAFEQVFGCVPKVCLWSELSPQQREKICADSESGRVTVA